MKFESNVVISYKNHLIHQFSGKGRREWANQQGFSYCFWLNSGLKEEDSVLKKHQSLNRSPTTVHWRSATYCQTTCFFSYSMNTGTQLDWVNPRALQEPPSLPQLQGFQAKRETERKMATGEFKTESLLLRNSSVLHFSNLVGGLVRCNFIKAQANDQPILV